MDKTYWDSRYRENQTGWDLGEVSPPLKKYFDQIEDKSLFILIPGSGNSHEVKYLWENGFSNVHALDISELAFLNLKKTCPDFPDSQMLCQDFFELNKKFDLIIEQTFFCALQPKLRNTYLKKMSDLITSNGKLVGLLFNIEFEGGPPFGGSKEEYLNSFQKYLEVEKMENSYNSIQPRADNELFFIAKSKPI